MLTSAADAAAFDPVGVGVDLAVGDVLPHPASSTTAANAPTQPATDRVLLRLPDIP
ncbi:MAG TPA: hypothetical protein VIJ00_07285 [Nakamurella sp.]